MREIESEFERAGIAVRFVTPSTPEETASGCARFGEASWCIADPSQRSYRAMGFGRLNPFKLFTDPDLKKRRDENNAAGFSQDWRATARLSTIKTGTALPGAAVVDAAGDVKWIHRGAHPGDLPPMDAMLDTARELIGIRG